MNWREQAACWGEDTALWFPTDGLHLVAPREVCDRCPVREACLEYALSFDRIYGIWGGTSERERRKLIAERNKARRLSA